MTGSEKVNYRLRNLAGFFVEGFTQLLWPAVCVNCDENITDSKQFLCNNCWRSFQSCLGSDYCKCCGRDATGYAIVEGKCTGCRDETLEFDGLVRIGAYSSVLQRLILAFKNNREELDVFLGPLARQVLQIGNFYNKVDYIVPVPLHWRRHIVRGYNQSFLLARYLRHPIAKVSTDLVRIRHTKPQPMTASYAQRRNNVAGAFAVRRGHNFTDKNICLIDDIKTSGATLSECARVLKMAGASNVFALVLAVAGRKNN
jgi:ComF family protein